MPVLLFQAFIVFTIFVGSFAPRSIHLGVAGGWSLFSLVMVFMPWLLILQLAVIWGSYFIFRRTEKKPAS